MNQQGAAELFQQWQKMATETAQTWARLYTAQKQPEVNPLDMYRQMSEAWMNAFSGAFKNMPANDTAAARKFWDESLEMWTKTLADLMGGPEYATQMAQVLSQNVASQAAAKRAMEPYLEEAWRTFNLPSRKQVLAIAEQLKTIEERLEELEESVERMRATPPPAPAEPGPAKARPAVNKKRASEA